MEFFTKVAGYLLQRIPMHGQIDEKPHIPSGTAVIGQGQAQADHDRHPALAFLLSQHPAGLPCLPTGQSAMLGSNDRFSIYTGIRELCLKNVGGEFYCRDEFGYWWILSGIIQLPFRRPNRSNIAEPSYSTNNDKCVCGRPLPERREQSFERPGSSVRRSIGDQSHLEPTLEEFELCDRCVIVNRWRTTLQDGLSSPAELS